MTPGPSIAILEAAKPTRERNAMPNGQDKATGQICDLGNNDFKVDSAYSVAMKYSVSIGQRAAIAGSGV